MSRRADCWDNAVIESFFARLKTELLHRQSWPTARQAQDAIARYIEGWYNALRADRQRGEVELANRPKRSKRNDNGQRRRKLVTSQHLEFLSRGDWIRTSDLILPKQRCVPHATNEKPRETQT